MEDKLIIAQYVLNQILKNRQFKFILAAMKGFRNGVV